MKQADAVLYLETYCAVHDPLHLENFDVYQIPTNHSFRRHRPRRYDGWSRSIVTSQRHIHFTDPTRLRIGANFSNDASFALALSLQDNQR